MGRIAFGAGLLLAILAPGAAVAGDGKDAEKIPPGESSHEFEGHKFDIRVPAGDAPERKFSLLLAIDTRFNELGDADALVREGFVICIPHAKAKGRGGWATSEAGDLPHLVDHLCSVLPLARDRIHILMTADFRGFSTFIAYDKASQAASLCFLNAYSYGGKSPSDAARKRLAVLSLRSDPPSKYGDGSDVVAKLAGKVKTGEHRVESPAQPYFRYWLLVADDRFVPGWDLSLDWLYDAPAAKPKPGDKPPLAPALERAKAAAASGKRGAMVYLWSAGDAAKAEAKALQNDLLFRPEVRSLAGRMVPVRAERERREKEFAAFGLKSTPAVVVTDAAFAPVKSFEGAVDEKGLLEAMRKVAAPEVREK